MAGLKISKTNFGQQSIVEREFFTKKFKMAERFMEYNII